MTRVQEDGLLNNIKNFWLVRVFITLGLSIFGKNWKKIEDVVLTRNGAQIRSHAQKYFLKLKKAGKRSNEHSNNHNI